MATTLHFRNQQIGDHVIRVLPATPLLTPPARRVGLWRDLASVNSDSRNLLRSITVDIAAKRTSYLTFAQFAQAVMELQGLVGDVEIREGGTRRLLLNDWTFDVAPPPDTQEGHGGRFVAAWPLTFVGESQPVWS